MFGSYVKVCCALLYSAVRCYVLVVGCTLLLDSLPYLTDDAWCDSSNSVDGYSESAGFVTLGTY